MAGRPPLRIGQHGKIKRINLGGGMWAARCRFRDLDGVTRIVERRASDRYGKAAEAALLAALQERQTPTGDNITLDTKLTALIDAHIAHLTDEGRCSEATLDTYRSAARKLTKFISGLRIGDVTPPRVDTALQAMRTNHGPGMARHSRVLIRAGLHRAVTHGVLDTNPGRETSPIRQQRKPKGAPALSHDQLDGLLAGLHSSQYCHHHDLVDPITMLAATGLRRSELLALRWVDYDEVMGIVAITGKLLRVKGKGLVRVEVTKSEAGDRTLPLPRFAIEMLAKRRQKPFLGEQEAIFCSMAGTWRDPSNFGRDWRRVRDKLGLPNITSHSFRKSVATLIDEEGLSARVGADHLGHAKVSMTQDRYMARGRVHNEVADLLDRHIR